MDDFIIIDSILQNESRANPTPSDLLRWAEGRLPTYGINSWNSGILDFPVVGDGNGAIFNQYGAQYLPTNIIIGSDFVLDFYEAGWDEGPIRCCIEKNVCEMMPAGFVLPSTGTNCAQTFNCVWDGNPVCTG